MMLRKTILKTVFLSWFVILGSWSVAQNRIITGTVSASDNGETLPMASVQIKGTSLGTTTDANGQYQIEVSSPDVILIFSFVGYESLEVNTFVHIKVWKPRISPIKFKLEGGDAGTLESPAANEQVLKGA